MDNSNQFILKAITENKISGNVTYSIGLKQCNQKLTLNMMNKRLDEMFQQQEVVEQ